MWWLGGESNEQGHKTHQETKHWYGGISKTEGKKENEKVNQIDVGNKEHHLNSVSRKL